LLTEEHVISAGLGCREILADCQCKQCNDAFGHSLEAPFLNGIVFFRHMLRIPGRDGRVPEYRCQGRVDGRDVPVVFTGEGFVEIPPQVVADATDEQGRLGKEYRVFKRGQDAIIEANLKRRHKDLAWRRNPEDKSRGVIEVRAEFDSNVLCLSETNRCVAKYGLNILTHCYARSYVANRFRGLRRFIQTGMHEGAPPAGIIWNEALVRRVQASPPKHVLILFADGRRHRIVLFMHFFSLFPFCIVAPDVDVSIDLLKSFYIDPYEGRLNPMIVGAYPVPEVLFSEALANEPRGTTKQAHAAGAYAHKWILKTCEERRASDDHCLCYECGRALETPANVCPYCGKAPFPDAMPDARSSEPS